MGMKSLAEFYDDLGMNSGLFQGAAFPVRGVPGFSLSTLDTELLFLDSGFFCMLRVDGPDTLDFINGQISSNLAALQSGFGQISSSSTAKGKVLGLMEVYRLDGQIFLHHPASASSRVQTSLETYHFCEDLKLTQLSDYYSLSFPGSYSSLEAAEVFGVEFSEEAMEREVLQKDGRLFFKGLFLNHPGLTVLTPFEADLKEISSKNFTPLAERDMQEIRIRELYPFPETEYTEESILAPELSQEGIISYSKGCFMGQEVFARIRTYGHTNKTLAMMQFADASTENLVGQTIEVQGKSKGKITSQSTCKDGLYALGYIPTPLKEIGAKVHAGPSTGTIVK